MNDKIIFCIITPIWCFNISAMSIVGYECWLDRNIPNVILSAAIVIVSIIGIVLMGVTLYERGKLDEATLLESTLLLANKIHKIRVDNPLPRDIVKQIEDTINPV